MSTFNSPAAYLAAMNRRKGAVVRELERAARTLAPLANREAKTEMQQGIYNVPIPLKASSDKKLSPKAAVRSKTTKGKHGAWQRTGNLKRRESAKAESTDVVLKNDAAYAVARHTLGTAEGRKIVSDGVQSVQWQAEAVEKIRPRVLQERREAVLRALRR